VGKVRDFESKTKMPQFNLTAEQATAIAAIVVGHENKNVRDEAVRKIDGRMEQVIEGHRLTNRYNCVGCHAIENRDGHVLSYYQADPTLGPPNLNT
jgi:mono/diheme cytochrome c family protein